MDTSMLAFPKPKDKGKAKSKKIPDRKRKSILTDDLKHYNQTDCKGIHFDKKLCLKWQKIGQKAFMEYYNKTIEEFIQIFGRNYL